MEETIFFKNEQKNDCWFPIEGILLKLYFSKLAQWIPQYSSYCLVGSLCFVTGLFCIRFRKNVQGPNISFEEMGLKRSHPFYYLGTMIA